MPGICRTKELLDAAPSTFFRSTAALLAEEVVVLLFLWGCFRLGNPQTKGSKLIFLKRETVVLNVQVSSLRHVFQVCDLEEGPTIGVWLSGLRYEYFSSRSESKLDALVAGIEGLNMLMRNLDSAYLCPLLAAKNFKLVAEWATAAGFEAFQVLVINVTTKIYLWCTLRACRRQGGVNRDWAKTRPLWSWVRFGWWLTFPFFKAITLLSEAVNHPWRARCLLQLGNTFKLQAASGGQTQVECLLMFLVFVYCLSLNM